MSIPSKEKVCAARRAMKYHFEAYNERLLYDFKDGKGPVSAHRHLNPDGTIGGWVADTARVSPAAQVMPFAVVFGYALVMGGACVAGNARVFGHAVIANGALVTGQARVFERAVVYSLSSETVLTGSVAVFGRAEIADEVLYEGDRS